jgi:hypothetical protein
MIGRESGFLRLDWLISLRQGSNFRTAGPALARAPANAKIASNCPKIVPNRPRSRQASGISDVPAKPPDRIRLALTPNSSPALRDLALAVGAADPRGAGAGGGCQQRRPRGRPVQVDPVKPTLKAPGTNFLTLKYDGLL